MSGSGREHREVAVIGAGLLGLAAGRALARRGLDVVVLEQAGQPGHARSGSRGASRVFRLGYEDPAYVRMAILARQGWLDLAEESGRPLLWTTGQLDLGSGLDQLAAAMTAADAPFERMTASSAVGRFPTVAVSGPVLWEPDSGVLSAAEVLDALVAASGAELRTSYRVRGIRQKGGRGGVVIDHDAGSLIADMAVVCAGPWSAPLLASVGIDLALTAGLEQIAYFRPQPGVALESLPIVLERPTRGPLAYGLPTPALGLYKLAFHHGGVPVSASEVSMQPDPALDQTLAALARRLLPGLVPEVVSSERCLYDNSPDQDFVLDRVGDIVIGAGTSGHGFKFGPLWGDLLSSLVTGDAAPVDLSPFSCRRPGLSVGMVPEGE
jgi:sarcosine oxidase